MQAQPFPDGAITKAGSRSHLSAIADDAIDTVRKAVQDGKAAATDQYEATAAWVGNMAKDKPLRTLGVVAAVGVAIGLLLGRR